MQSYQDPSPPFHSPQCGYWENQQGCIVLEQMNSSSYVILILDQRNTGPVFGRGSSTEKRTSSINMWQERLTLETSGALDKHTHSCSLTSFSEKETKQRHLKGQWDKREDWDVRSSDLWICQQSTWTNESCNKLNTNTKPIYTDILPDLISKTKDLILVLGSDVSRDPDHTALRWWWWSHWVSLKLVK